VAEEPDIAPRSGRSWPSFSQSGSVGEDGDLSGDWIDGGEPTPMEDERIETRWFTAKQLDEMIRAGESQRQNQHRLSQVGAIAGVSEHLQSLARG
jgi:hypothetical protein